MRKKSNCMHFFHEKHNETKITTIKLKFAKLEQKNKIEDPNFLFFVVISNGVLKFLINQYRVLCSRKCF